VLSLEAPTAPPLAAIPRPPVMAAVMAAKRQGGGQGEVSPLAPAASGPGAPGLSMPGTPGSHRGQYQTGTTTSGPLAASATPSAGDTPATPPEKLTPASS